jgi:hypothetical protein
MKLVLFAFLFSVQIIVSQTKDGLSKYSTFLSKNAAEKDRKADDSIRKIKFKEQIVNDELEAKRRELEASKREKEAMTKYGIKTYNKLKGGYFWIGITREMAIISLGNPIDINKTVGSWGVHEQWVYNNNMYLYFENDKLTSYQR